MTLTGFRSFCALVETRTMQGAAERIHRSQPAVTQQLRALEKEVGEPLWDRRAGVPTSAGELLYRRARSILSQVDGLSHEMQDLAGQAPTELRVGISDTHALYLLPEPARRFRKQWPDTRLRVLSRSSGLVETAVIEGELDFGIVTLPAGNDQLESMEILEDKFVCIVPAKHRLASQRSVKLVDVEGEALVLLEEETRTGRLLLDAFREASITPNTVLDSGSFEVVVRYVDEGFGCSIIPESALGAVRHSRVAAIATVGLPSIRYGAIWRKRAYLSVVAQSLIDGLKRD